MTDSLSPEHQEISDFEEHGHQRTLIGLAAIIAMIAAFSFSAYQISVAAFHPFSSLVIRALHVSFLLLLIFMFYPATAKGRTSKKIPWYDMLLALVGFSVGFYHLIFEGELIERSGDPSTADLVIATIATILVFEAARRVVGWALTLVCGMFLIYGFFGQYFTLSIAHRGFGFDQIVSQLYLGSDGILGTPTLVSATYIFLFILFGTFLEHAGMIRLFNALALGLVGQAQGGPAKVAVISSGLMGTIS
ncbi:MAG: TRAP transporter large permease subunit, partial [Campylobacteraceae bacterium]|nr:TRAP transporter large permease subunit [Campylobacteraceae bacterium]